MSKASFIGWDWKSRPSFEELEEALEEFGIFVYIDPMSEGSDHYGYIFSDEELTDSEVVEKSNEYHGC